jgi:pimeloyl-ACP methyl ester carboxylesterase
VCAVIGRYRLATAAPRPYGGFRSGWTDVGGLRMHARTGGTGTGPRLVLVHGLAVSHRYLMPTAALLGRRHPVAVPDLPGFGLSPEPGRVLGTRELADALGGWIAATGTGPVVLLGNSYGCQVLVDLVTRTPAVASAVVLAGPTVDPRARSATRQVLRWLADAPREDPTQGPVLLRDARDAGLRRLVGTLRHSVRDRIEVKLPAVTVPALVVRGGVEPVVPDRWARQAAGLLPHGELAVLPGSPHNSVYSAAELLAATVEDFLTRVL